MGFTNLNEIYLSTVGGNIEGDVEVEGSIVIKDGFGSGEDCDVAVEIANLQNDYIVERFWWTGGNGRDVYNVEKWASGYCRAAGRVDYTDVSITTSNSLGSFYHVSSNGWSIPPYFVEISFADVFIKHGTGLFGACVRNISDNCTSFDWILYSANNMTLSPTIYITFEGRWK